MHGTTTTEKAGAALQVQDPQLFGRQLPARFDPLGPESIFRWSDLPHVPRALASLLSQRGLGVTEASGREAAKEHKPCCLSPQRRGWPVWGPTCHRVKAAGQPEPAAQGESYTVSFLCFHYNFLSHCFFGASPFLPGVLRIE